MIQASFDTFVGHQEDEQRLVFMPYLFSGFMTTKSGFGGLRIPDTAHMLVQSSHLFTFLHPRLIDLSELMIDEDTNNHLEYPFILLDATLAGTGPRIQRMTSAEAEVAADRFLGSEKTNLQAIEVQQHSLLQ